MKHKHWKLREAERTLCGRIPKGVEVDPTWPLCKTCDKATRYMTRTYTFLELTKEQQDEAIAKDREKRAEAGEPEEKFHVFFTSASVTELHEPRKRNAS